MNENWKQIMIIMISHDNHCHNSMAHLHSPFPFLLSLLFFSLTLELSPWLRSVFVTIFSSKFFGLSSDNNISRSSSKQDVSSFCTFFFATGITDSLLQISDAVLSLNDFSLTGMEASKLLILEQVLAFVVFNAPKLLAFDVLFWMSIIFVLFWMSVVFIVTEGFSNIWSETEWSVWSLTFMALVLSLSELWSFECLLLCIALVLVASVFFSLWSSLLVAVSFNSFSWLSCKYRRHIQSTLVISTSIISNNRLSRRENLIPLLT